MNIWCRVRYAEFVCNLDPSFVGLYGKSMEVGAGGATYFRHHSFDRSTTIVLAPLSYKWAADNLPYIVAHEYGHVLHETLKWNHIAGAISDYAETDAYEAFAEAFAYYLGFDRKGVRWKFSPDLRTTALFRELATASPQ